MNAVVNQVVATCLRTVLGDEAWQDFGFRKRPRYGKLLQRFRASWKVELEKRVIQQMVSVLTASHVVAGKLPYDAIKDAIALYTQTPSVTSAFGFSSQGEGMQQLQGDVQRFVASPPDEWPNILFANLKATSLPDQALKARLILGCAQFGTAAKNMIGILKWQST